MFNSLASYILGNSTNRNSTDIKQENQDLSTATDQSIDHFNFITTNCSIDDEEDDWMLIEKTGDSDSTPQQTDSEEEVPFVEIKNFPSSSRTRHSRNNSNAGSQDGAYNSLLPSSPVPNSMDESWFVTPPPCFTSTGPVNVEISPFENLLIEHPSMSVYHSIRSSAQLDNSVDETVDQDGMVLVDINSVEDEPTEIIQPELNRASGQTTRRVFRNQNHVNNLTAQQVKQVVALKHSQKMHDKKIRQQMCRNAMERGNKVREANCKGGRQKRSDMTHCKVISRANNNRKC